jgi:hypothetical protein
MWHITTICLSSHKRFHIAWLLYLFNNAQSIIVGKTTTLWVVIFKIFSLRQISCTGTMAYGIFHKRELKISALQLTSGLCIISIPCYFLSLKLSRVDGISTRRRNADSNLKWNFRKDSFPRNVIEMRSPWQWQRSLKSKWWKINGNYRNLFISFTIRCHAAVNFLFLIVLSSCKQRSLCLLATTDWNYWDENFIFNYWKLIQFLNLFILSCCCSCCLTLNGARSAN